MCFSVERRDHAVRVVLGNGFNSHEQFFTAVILCNQGDARLVFNPCLPIRIHNTYFCVNVVIRQAIWQNLIDSAVHRFNGISLACLFISISLFSFASLNLQTVFVFLYTSSYFSPQYFKNTSLGSPIP